jgi:hypothetical protein
MNLSLLAKWRWKLLLGENEIWKSVVVARYVDGVVGNINLDVEILRHDISSWWRNICRLDVGTRWFNNTVKKIVGNGRTIRFWRDVWVAGLSLEERFPRLFSISNQQDAMLSDVGWWEDGIWIWGLLWRRNFFVWEENLLLQLRQVLAQVTLSEADRIGGCGFREVRMFLA